MSIAKNGRTRAETQVSPSTPPPSPILLSYLRKARLLPRFKPRREADSLPSRQRSRRQRGGRRRIRSSVNRRRKIGPRVTFIRRHFVVYYCDMPCARYGRLKGNKRAGEEGGGGERSILLFASELAILLSSRSQLPMRHCRLLLSICRVALQCIVGERW